MPDVDNLARQFAALRSEVGAMQRRQFAHDLTAAFAPNLTATMLQTRRWKLGKPPSRLRQRCAVRRLGAARCMPELSQFAQTAVCNRHHSVDQQLCRCLLLSLDRLASNKPELDRLLAYIAR